MVDHCRSVDQRDSDRIGKVCSMFDLILRGGRVFDGAANSDFPASVAIENGRIAALGTLQSASARVEVNVAGLAVGPVSSTSTPTRMPCRSAQSRCRPRSCRA